MKFRGGEFSTGTTGNFQSELTERQAFLLALHAAQGDTATETVPVSRAEHKIVFILFH
jgi:hypothetical protein